VSDPLVHCVIVRPGLEVGMVAAQVLHAAAESAAGLHDATTHALVLEARTEDAGVRLGQRGREEIVRRGLVRHRRRAIGVGRVRAAGLAPRGP